ncbi:MAG: DUF2303 family protein [Epsilonproteobacteria bacterium]|nr:DUF2303 family protein [Campylobacterota bacterium]
MFEKLIKLVQRPSEQLNGRVLVHKDYEIKADTNYRPPLARNVIAQSILDKYDFIEFVNEYKEEQTKLFYNENQIKAVFNYPLVDEADYGDSFCVMGLRYTNDFSRFSSMLEKKMSQKEFIMMLKTLEPYIVGFDGKEIENMDIIEIAENLQATKNINSIQRNTQQKFTLDVEISTGHSEMTIPRYISFEFPIFKNDLQLKTRFEVELFLGGSDDGFEAVLMCYKLEQQKEEALKELTKEVQNGLDGVDSFMS